MQDINLEFESQIRELVTNLKNLKIKYKNMKHSQRDEVCEAMYKASSEAYQYCENKLISIFKWCGKEI